MISDCKCYEEIKLNDVIKWPQTLGSEEMGARDGLSEEVPFELRPEWYRLRASHLKNWR